MKYIKKEKTKKLAEEFVELMRDKRGNDVYDLIESIEGAFLQWVKDTQKNFTVEDFEDWGYTDFYEMAVAAADEIKDSIENRLEDIFKREKL